MASVLRMSSSADFEDAEGGRALGEGGAGEGPKQGPE